ncbi:helix-turn-helix domain-containing protein [Vibrio eleionomae]|nr:XRE family transcriptional regulator [Vibrio eleionomae]
MRTLTMEAPESHLKQHISQHLKALRAERKLSLDAVAKLTGVSKAMLGQIEREESSPTIAKLWQIASGLDTSFSAFLSSAHSQPRRQEDVDFPDDPNMQIVPMMPYDPRVKLEMFDIHLSNHHEQHSEAHAHGVLETVWVLEGTLDLFYDNEWHTFVTQDTVRFYADQPHTYRANSPAVRFQNIVHYT